MKSSSPLSPGRGLATRAVSAVLVFAVFVMGALLGGILNGGTAWAQQVTTTPTSTATVTPLAPTPTATSIPSSTPSAPLVTNLPAFSCGDGATVKQVIWAQNTWTVTLDCPNLKFKTAGVSD